MAGFLDKNAPSPESEYSRYLDGDILGKFLPKAFLLIGLDIKLIVFIFLSDGMVMRRLNISLLVKLSLILVMGTLIPRTG